MSSRIPASLQAVFLAGNRGKEVYTPPPGSAANKTFLRNWIFQNTGEEGNSKKKNARGKKNGTCSLFGDSQDKIKCLANPELTTATSVTNTTKARNVGEHTKRSSSSSPSDATTISSVSPQEFLDKMLRERGYSTDKYNTLLTAYRNKPTSHQQASYGMKMSEITKQGEVDAMRQMLAGGLSANPANAYGESILHLVCRRGNIELLQVLQQHGCNFEICDDYGRTPLHDACWSPRPAFACVELLLQHADARLFYMMDRRGALPLSYVHKDHYPAWIAFIDQIKDVHWPVTVYPTQGPPVLCKYGPNSRPLPNPKHACLADHLCTMVANGRLTIDEALMIAKEEAAQKEEEGDAATADLTCDDDDCSDDSDSDDDGSDDDDDDDDGSDDDSDCSDYDSSSFDEDELEAELGLFDVLQMTKAYASQSSR